MRDNFIHTRRAYWPPLCTQTMQGYVCTPSYSALLGSSSGTTFATDLRNRHTHRCYNSIQFLILTMCMCIFHVRFHDWKSAQGDPSCPFRLNLNPSSTQNPSTAIPPIRCQPTNHHPAIPASNPCKTPAEPGILQKPASLSPCMAFLARFPIPKCTTCRSSPFWGAQSRHEPNLELKGHGKALLSWMVMQLFHFCIATQSFTPQESQIANRNGKCP